MLARSAGSDGSDCFNMMFISEGEENVEGPGSRAQVASDGRMFSCSLGASYEPGLVQVKMFRPAASKTITHSVC